MRPSWGFLQIVQNWAQDGADECLVDSGHVGAGGTYSNVVTLRGCTLFEPQLL